MITVLMVSATVRAAPTSVVQWQETLDQTSTLLAEAKFTEARRRLLKLTSEMADEITEPSGVDRLFGIALAQLAIAEAGEGNAGDAVWLWQTAQNVYPDIRTLDLSVYGKLSDILSANVLPPAPEKCARPANAPAPAVLRRSEPKYPKRAGQTGITGVVIVET